MVVSKRHLQERIPMANSTVAAASTATPDLQAFMVLLGPSLQELYDQVEAFRKQPPTPERTCALEKNLAAILRAMGRVLVEHEYNHIEPERVQDCPLRFEL